MPKLIFRVNADTSPVKKFRAEIEQIEKAMIRIKGENFSFDHWIKEFDRLKTELEKKRAQIDDIKKNILTVHPVWEKKKFDSLNTELSKSSKERDALINDTISLSNKFGKAYDDLVATLGKAQKVTDEVTSRFIQQKQVVANLQSEVRSLNAEYRNANKGDKVGIRSQITSKQKELEQQRVTLNALKAEQERAKLAVKGLSDETRNYEKVVGKVSGAQAEANLIFSRFEKSLLRIGGLATLQRFASDVVRVRGEFQQLEIAFETMLKSKDKASALMGQLTETAAKTPFDLQGIAQGAKQLLAYGTAAEDVNDTLVRLGNIASGLSIPLNDLVWLYGTTQTQGRLFTQDVRQFMGRGIPLVKELAKELGKTEQQINEMVTAGKIGFPEVEKVIRNMTNEGGQFYNLMEKQSASLTGQISNLGDAWNMMLNKIGTQTQGIASAGISTVTSLIENYEEVGRILIGLIGTYGVARTAIALTALENGKYIFTLSKLTTALKASTIAQKALNLAVLKNPYVIVAVAVGTLITTLWSLHDSTTAAEKAQKHFNERQKEAQKQEQEHKQKIDSLVESSRDIALADLQRGESLAELRKEYPKIFAKYDIESIKLADILKLKRQIAEEDNKRANVTDQEQLRLETLKLREYEQRKKEGVVLIDIDGNGWGETNIDDAIKAQLELVNKAKARVAQYGVNSYLSGIKNLASSDITSTIQDITLSLQALGKSGDDAIAVVASLGGEFSKAQLNAIKAALETEQKVRSGEKKSGGDWVADAKKEYEKALSDLKTFETNKTQLTKEEYERRRKELKDKADIAEKKYKDLGGITGSALTKQENQAEKLRKEQEKYNLLVDKQELERIRKAEDLETQLAQTTIDAMSDGFEKEQAQRELNNKKEIQVLNRQKEDYIRAYVQAEREKFNANPANKGKTFNPSSVKVDVSKWDAIIENTKINQGLNEWEKREEAMNEYLLKYGTFSQKKEAIDKKYRAAIDKEVDLGKKNSLQKEWDEALTNLDLSKLKEEINWEMIFGDLSKVTREQLRNIKKQLQEFKNSPEFQKATPEQIEVIESAFNSINNALVDKGGFFGGMVDSVTELKLATEELKKAEEELAEANKKGTEAQKEEAQKKVNAAKKKKQNAEVNVTKSSDKTIQHLTAVGDAIAQLGSSAEMSLSSFGNAAANIVDAFTEAGSKISGIVGAIFSILDGIQQQGFDKFVVNILENVAGAALSAGTFGLISKNESDKNLERDIEYLTQSNQDLKNSLDNLSEKMDKASVIESNDIYKVQKENLEKQESNTREAMQRSGAAYSNGFLGIGGSHSSNDKINKGMSASEWKRVSDVVGKSVYDASSFFQLSSEQMAKLAEEDTSLYSKIKDLANDGYKDAAQYMDEYITYYKQLEKLENAHNEKLTNTSFDSVRDEFKNALLDMESDAEDFTNNFEKMMQNAIIESLMTKKYDALLQDWYEELANAMEDDGKIDEDEQRFLKGKWNDIVNKGIAERDALKDVMGWESESTRKASQKGIATASQDSVDENNGRLTVIQGHTYGINENVTRIATGINTLTEHTKHLTCLADIDNTMQSLLTMRKESIEHLSNIAEYTSNLVEMRNDMHSMRQDVNTMLIKGMKLSKN